MKKLVLLFFLVMHWCVAKAQVDYSFSGSSGTYMPLSGATTAALTAANPGGKTLLDEAFTNNVPIGFSFQYNGLNYSVIHLNANGVASLGAPYLASPTDPTYDQNELRAATGFRGATRPVLAPFWDNLAFTNLADLTYKTEGTAPNRVFTAQWQNMAWQGGSPALSFQLKLYETTNVVEFVYRQESSAGGSGRSASIGITAETGAALLDEETIAFVSLGNAGSSPPVSSTLETETIADRPATGQVYRFTPSACAAPAGMRTVAYSQNAATIQWTGRAGSGGYQYAINNMEVVPNTLTNTGQTEVTLTGLVPNQAYYVYVRNGCGSPWRVMSFKTPTVASVPYSEGFEAALDNALPRNMRRENVSNSFADVFWQTSNGVSAATGSKAAFNSAPFVTGQTWLYTPGLSLVGGTAYQVSFKTATTAGPQGLEVRWGTQVGAAAMTNTLFNQGAIANGAYQTNTSSFVAPATGTYYIGFLYKSAPNNGLLTLDDIAVTVDANVVAVTGVTVSPGSTTMLVGNSAQLTATVLPANASNKTVSWSSNNTAVATVDNNGLIIGVGAGTATITVTTADGNRTATSSVVITAPTVNQKPVAVLNASTSSGVAPLAVSFNANGSSDPDAGNTIAGYEWNFGDGSANQSVAAPSHSFTATGIFTVTLRVRDNNNLLSDPVTRTITVTAPTSPTSSTGTSGTALALWDFAGKGGQNNLLATTKVADVGTATAQLGAGLAVINYLGNGLTGTEQTATNLAGALSGNDFFSFRVAPVAGKNLTINKVDIRPVSQNVSRTFVVFSSVNGFSSGAQLGTFTGQDGQGAALQSLTISNHNSLTGTVEFRVYVYGPTNFYESTGVGNRNGAAGAYDLAVFGSSGTVSNPPVANTGKIIREFWSGVSGNETSLIPVAQPPSGTAILTSLEGPTNWADTYGARIRGYVIPSTTGAYTFYVAGDDYVDLHLSSNDNPANKTRIAFVAGWTTSRLWTKYPSQKSAVMNLVAGQKYYVEILHKEGGGGDNVAVGWTGPGISAITVIGGVNIAPYVVPGSARVAVSEPENVRVQVYPNPVSQELTVVGLLTESTVEIIGSDGRVMRRHEHVTDRSQLTVSELNTGLYVVRISNEVQGVVNRKIVKQ